MVFPKFRQKMYLTGCSIPTMIITLLFGAARREQDSTLVSCLFEKKENLG